MRVESFEIANYKGIEYATADSLAANGAVTLSGRNGTGKSLILEAIVSAWERRWDLSRRVGPFGDDMVIHLALQLETDELEAVTNWLARSGKTRPSASNLVQFSVTASRLGNSYSYPTGDPAAGTLANENFRRENAFATIDFLPATRVFPLDGDVNIALDLLDAERTRQERINMLDRAIEHRSPMALPNIESYLATVDYQTLLAERQGSEQSSEFSHIADTFLAATGKVISRPHYDPKRGTSIDVKTQAGMSHGLKDLSSGELELLGIMYFVRRLSGRGGVLCIDEPEQHLHPSLQGALLEVIEGLSTAAQVIMVSHSVNVVVGAPAPGLLAVRHPIGDGSNQIVRVADEGARLDLVAELGLSPSDLVRSDLLLVVEGATDEALLKRIYPVELARAHVLVAGSRRQVIEAHGVLLAAPISIPWLCVVDRDLASDRDVEELKASHQGIFVWPRREIESEFLSGPLLAATYRDAGAEAAQDEAMDELLSELATPLKEDVIAQLLRAELRSRVPPPSVPSGLGRFAKMKQEYSEYAAVNKRWVDEFEDAREAVSANVEDRWRSEWPVLVDPKPVLEMVRTRLGVFATGEAMRSALARKLHLNADLRGGGVVELAEVLRTALARSSAPSQKQ